MKTMLFDNILIKPLKAKHDLIIPDGQARIPNKGEVIKVGPGAWYGYPEFVATSLKVGDVVLFSKDRALRVELKDEEYFVAQEKDVLSVLDKDEV